jgi:hypothetical protein
MLLVELQIDLSETQMESAIHVWLSCAHEVKNKKRL